jgi:AcrR family transcriptional regulator
MPGAGLRQKGSAHRKPARTKSAARTKNTKRPLARRVRSLPDEQADRRAAITEAVLQLAEEGGYDRIQLRAVSKRSGVAMRTIYKYFGSREALITSAMTEWRTQNLRKAMAAGKGDDFIDRYLSILHYSFNVFRAKPKLWETLARMQQEGQPLDQGIEIDAALMRQAFKDVDETFFREFERLIGSLFYSSMMFSVFGKYSFDEAWSHIERTVRRFARSYPYTNLR